MVEGVEARERFKQPFECQTTFFQETYIGLAVLNQFFAEVKEFIALLLMPGFQGLLAFGGHGFRHVVIKGRDGSYVVLMVWMIELVGEVPFAEFCQSKGFGKRGQRHLEETQRVDEADTIVLDLQEFTPVPELLDDPVVAIVLMNDKVAIVPLEVMGQYINLAGIMECQGIQPFQEISDAMVARETHGLVVVFGFGHDEVSDVLFLGLHGFNIKEDMKGWYAVLLIVFLLLGCGIHPTFGARPSLSFPLSFLALSGYLNKTTMSCTVHVLMTAGTINVATLMLVNVASRK